MDIITQFANAHPLYSHGLTLIVGGFLGPKLVSYAEGKIPDAIDWLNSHQVAALKKLGLSPEAIRSVQRHEVDDMREAASDLERQINADEAAAAHLEGSAPAPAPAADAPK